MPVLKKKFTSYDSFKGVMDINDFFDDYKDKLVENKWINEMRSGVFISSGQTYTYVPFPQEDQMSDIKCFGQNGSNDIVYIGNHHDYVAENGKSSSNPGRVLGKFNVANNTFDKSSKLPLPISLNPRKLRTSKKNQFIITSNNDDIFVLEAK
jgi:hypothetical protein